MRATGIPSTPCREQCGTSLIRHHPVGAKRMIIPWNSVRGSKPIPQGFLKLMDSLDLDAGPITTWEDLTTRFLAQFFPHGRTAKLCGKLRDRKAKESWALLEDLTIYENKSWNNPRDFTKPVKAISLPQDVQMNKITSSCDMCSGPHDTQYNMENPEQAFVKYASSRTNEAGGLVSNFMASQDARLSKFEADFKQQQSEIVTPPKWVTTEYGFENVAS
ncbi:hypothetical protein Tco_0463024 [Tanacetum coccineum]